MSDLQNNLRKPSERNADLVKMKGMTKRIRRCKAI